MIPERFERVRRHAPEEAEPRPAGRASDLVGVWGEPHDTNAEQDKSWL